MTQARITIIEPNGVRRSMPLGFQGLVIGRDPACELPLAYERVSRQHAQVAYDGEQYYIIDLESKNGTYLGKTRLTPNVPTPWPPDQPLRVGDVYINLEMPRQAAVRREEIGHMETMAGYIPPVAIEPKKDNRKMLWLGLGAAALICACAGLVVLAFLFLGTA
jgi:predicted component of type VI protein secretion system